MKDSRVNNAPPPPFRLSPIFSLQRITSSSNNLPSADAARGKRRGSDIEWTKRCKYTWLKKRCLEKEQTISDIRPTGFLGNVWIIHFFAFLKLFTCIGDQHAQSFEHFSYFVTFVLPFVYQFGYFHKHAQYPSVFPNNSVPLTDRSSTRKHFEY